MDLPRHLGWDVPTDARREVKCVADALEYHDLVHRLRLHPAGLRGTWPSRWVNSVYFDGSDLESCADNLAGVSRRTKVRLRWYGPLDHLEGCVLEVKHRQSALGWKERYPVEGRWVLGDVRWSRLRDLLLARLPAGAAAALAARPEAVVITRYHRDYFETAGGRVRVTVDRDLQVLDQRFWARPNARWPSPLPRRLVVEVKFPAGLQREGREVLRGLDLTPCRHSKYVSGVQAVLA